MYQSRYRFSIIIRFSIFLYDSTLAPMDCRRDKYENYYIHIKPFTTHRTKIATLMKLLQLSAFVQ